MISSKYVYEKFDKERITEFSKIIADPANTIISINSKSFKDEELPKLEPWYNINFHDEKFSEELIKLL